MESLTVLFNNRDLLLYDVGRMTPRNVYTGAEILLHSTNWLSFSLDGTPIGEEFAPESIFRISDDKGAKKDATIYLDQASASLLSPALQNALTKDGRATV